MSNDDKSQPVGWVVVRFDRPFDNFYDDNAEYYSADTPSALLHSLQPFKTAEDADVYRSVTEEVHPWPLPASVLARLKERHPTVDWSQVPVAVAYAPAVAEPSEVERLTRERDEAREQLAKATLSRRDEFAKAALAGLLASPDLDCTPGELGRMVVRNADATIRALDGVGGA